MVSILSLGNEPCNFVPLCCFVCSESLDFPVNLEKEVEGEGRKRERKKEMEGGWRKEAGKWALLGF